MRSAVFVAFLLTLGLLSSATFAQLFSLPLSLPYAIVDTTNGFNVSHNTEFLFCVKIDSDCSLGSIIGAYNYTFQINATTKADLLGNLIPYSSIMARRGLETSAAVSGFWCTDSPTIPPLIRLLSNGTNSTQDGLKVTESRINITASCTKPVVGTVTQSVEYPVKVGSIFWQDTNEEKKLLFGNFTGGTIRVKPYENLSLVNLSNGTAWIVRYEPISKDIISSQGYIVRYSNFSPTDAVPSPYVIVPKPAGEEWRFDFVIPGNAPLGFLTFQFDNGTYFGAAIVPYAAIPLRVDMTAAGQSKLLVSQGGIAEILLNTTNDYSDITSVSASISNLAERGVNTTANITYPNGTVQNVKVEVGVGAQSGKIFDLGGLKDKAGNYIYKINLSVPFRSGDYFVNATIRHATGYTSAPSVVVNAIGFVLDAALLDSKGLPRDAYARGETIFAQAAVQDKSVVPPRPIDARINFTITSPDLAAFPEKVFRAADAIIEAGVYKINLTLPADAPFGTWNFSVYGVDNSGNTYFFSKNFTLAAPALGILLEPTALSFNITTADIRTAIVNITNLGGALSNIVFNVSAAIKDFVVANNRTIPLPLATGAKSNFTVIITPADLLADGITSGTIIIAADGTQQTLPITLNTSLVPAINVNETIRLTLVQTADTVNFAIGNIGSRSLSGIKITVVGDSDGLLNIYPPERILPGASDVATLRFKQFNATGTFTLTLKIEADKAAPKQVTLEITVIKDFSADLLDLDRNVTLLEQNLNPFIVKGVNLGGLDNDIAQVRSIVSQAQSEYRNQKYTEAQSLAQDARTRIVRAQQQLQALAAQTGVRLGKDIGEIEKNTRAAQAAGFGGMFVIIIIVIIGAVAGVILFLSLVPITPPRTRMTAAAAAAT